ncbi:MAG: hypothetical protein WAL72_37850 [Streptosporangiaceae bacterium]
MRVFLPSTLPAVAQALLAGQVGPGPLPGFAVTPALRESYASGDTEELEYAALTEAARASLRLLASASASANANANAGANAGANASDPAAPSRRVVLAADIPAEHVKPDPRDGEPARVVIIQAVQLKDLAAAHVDTPDADADVRSAVEALPAADAGDEDARFTVDGAEGHELGWYATQELSYLAE